MKKKGKTLIEVFAEEEKKKGQPQDTDPHAPHYFAPFDDQGNKRTINNAVDCGWSAIEREKGLKNLAEEMNYLTK